MKKWHLFFLILLTTIVQVAAQNEPAYPLPPDVKILDSQMMRGPESFTRLAAQSHSTNQKQLDSMRAEVGVERGLTARRGNAPGAYIPMVDQGPSSNKSNSFSDTTTFLNMDSRQAPYYVISIQNTGARIIKSVEWEYAYQYFPTNKIDGSALLQGSKSWQKNKTKIKVMPQQIVQLNGRYPDVPKSRPSGGSTIATRGREVKITRIVYSTGPDWRAK